MTLPEPTISAVVPCRNEEKHIESCVRSILAQEPPEGDFELLVVDGCSDDRTLPILERLAQEDVRMRVVRNPARITPAAFNIGVREARGEFVAIMGAHNTYAPDYLKQAVAVHREREVDNVGGSMICRGHTWLQEAIAASHHSPFSVGGARWHDPNYEGPADTVFGGVYRREIFSRIGLFDESLVRNQDDELNLRLTRAGGRIWQSPRLVSWYAPRDTLRKLAHQYFQYGYWKVAVIRKHRLPASIRHVIPFLFVSGVVLLLGTGSAGLALASAVQHSPTATLSAGALGLAGAALGLWSVAALAASLATASRSRCSFVIVLPVIFGCYHFGYGLGFTLGLLSTLRPRSRSLATDLTR